jgi:hypothetical protein
MLANLPITSDTYGCRSVEDGCECSEREKPGSVTAAAFWEEDAV